MGKLLAQSAISDRVYFLLLIGSSLLALLSLGPGWYAQEVIAPFHWHYTFFSWVCHQDPSRSFDFLGIQMAVCSRCIGIYGAFAFGFWLKVMTPSLDIWPKTKLSMRLFFFFLGLTGFDVLFNALNIWTNTHYSRLLLGVCFGLMASLFMSSKGSTSSNTQL